MLAAQCFVLTRAACANFVFLQLPDCRLTAMAHLCDSHTRRWLQALFVALFFLSRIVNGYWACYWWWQDVTALLASNRAHSPPIVVGYMVCCILLCGLNGFWFSSMLMWSRRKKSHPTDSLTQKNIKNMTAPAFSKQGVREAASEVPPS